jgi:hypothetical protein
LDVTVTTRTTSRILVCKPQPCEHRSQTENHPSHNLIKCTPKNEEHTGNRSSDWFTCNKNNIHASHIETKEDHHRTSKLKWAHCTVQPCPFRAYQPGKIPKGYKEPSNENQELINPISEFELGPSDREEESTEGTRTESTKEPEEPAPDQEEQDTEEE